VTVKEAKSIAFGSRPATTLSEYYEAWQWLYDSKTELGEADMRYLDKLICDGLVK